MHSKVVKFDHIKIRVVNLFPSAKKLYRIAVTQPVFDYIGCTHIITFCPGHIC